MISSSVIGRWSVVRHTLLPKPLQWVAAGLTMTTLSPSHTSNMEIFTPEREKQGKDNEGMEREEDRDKIRDEDGYNNQNDNIYTISYKTTTDVLDAGPWWGVRHTLGLLMFLGLMLTYLVRVNLSIAIVAMVGSRTPNNTTHNLTDVCPASDNQTGNNYVEGDFDWNEQTQGIVLGAFFYGYTAGNFVGGRAAEYLGGRLVFGLGVVVPSFLSLFSALCASISKDLFIVLRVLEGLSQASVYPSINYMMAAWIPPKERGSYCAVVFSGFTFGTIVAMSVGGWLCSTNFLGGWPSIFYVFGVLGMAWGLPWFLVANDLPENHPSITQAELVYLTTHRTYVKKDKKDPLPIREIATSFVFWSLMVVDFGYNYVYYLFLTELPTYFNNIQHFDLGSNGLMSALPFLVQWLTMVGWGAVISGLTARNLITVNMVRKLSTGLGMYISAVGLITMIWVNCDSAFAMAVMCVAVGALGMVSSGCDLSEQDIAPNFTGSLKGMTNTIGAATGFIAPAITGAIVNNNQTLSAWRTVFVTGAVIGVVCTLQYNFFSTDKVQPWNEPKLKSTKEGNEA